MVYHYRLNHSTRRPITPLWCSICNTAWLTNNRHVQHMLTHDIVRDYEVPHGMRLWDRCTVPPPKKPRASENWRALYTMRHWNEKERRVEAWSDVPPLDEFLQGEPLLTPEGPRRISSKLPTHGEEDKSIAAPNHET